VVLHAAPETYHSMKYRVWKSKEEGTPDWGEGGGSGAKLGLFGGLKGSPTKNWEEANFVGHDVSKKGPRPIISCSLESNARLMIFSKSAKKGKKVSRLRGNLGFR